MDNERRHGSAELLRAMVAVIRRLHGEFREIARMLDPDADNWDSASDERLKYVIACSEALEPLAVHYGADPESYLPDLVDRALGDLTARQA